MQVYTCRMIMQLADLEIKSPSNVSSDLNKQSQRKYIR